MTKKKPVKPPCSPLDEHPPMPSGDFPCPQDPYVFTQLLIVESVGDSKTAAKSNVKRCASDQFDIRITKLKQMRCAGSCNKVEVRATLDRVRTWGPYMDKNQFKYIAWAFWTYSCRCVPTTPEKKKDL